MTRRLGLCAGVAAVLAGAAAAQPARSGKSAAAPADAAQQSCAARKFETVVTATVNGKRRQSNVKLCGKDGQTDAQWVATLRDAAEKVKFSATMAPESREQVVAALEAEIPKFETEPPKAAPAMTFSLPAQRPAATAAAPPATAPRRSDYSVLPPLPDPRTIPAPVAVTAPVAGVAGAAAPVAAPLLQRPRVTIGCLLPSDHGVAGPCSRIEAETRLSVRADENLPAGLRLRFYRRGSERGEVALAAMKQGQTLRVRPPARLCQGVAWSRTEIEIVKPGTGASGTGQAVERLGPYELHC